VIFAVDDDFVIETKIAPSVWIAKFDQDTNITKLADR